MEKPLSDLRSDRLQGVRGANMPTFDEARKECQASVFAFVSRRIKPPEEAEDVTAEVFLAAYRHWHRCRGPARLWLLGIARRKVADAYRRRGGEHLEVYDFQMGSVESGSQIEGLRAREVLQRLPPDERDALSLQVLEEHSIDEIATIMGRTHAATNSLLQRARARVRAAVAHEEDTQDER